MEKKFKVLPPMMPNFIKIEIDNGWVPVQNLNQDEAEQFGELMNQTFINHWKEQNEKIS